LCGALITNNDPQTKGKNMTTKTLWIGTNPDPDDRLQIQVNEADYEAVDDRSDEPFTVTDQRTGRVLTVARGDCGLGCRCALVLVKMDC
jgi:hypothetical protein